MENENERVVNKRKDGLVQIKQLEFVSNGW